MKSLFDQSTLKGWRAIAQYLGVSVSTVKRWEKHHSLVVRRWTSGRPFAFIFELDKYFLIFEEHRQKQKRKEKT
ncbi:MAG: hypothetical protein CVU62_08115 [Deltaproteobacteria bacterium HGW-Deltaproteobacteria-2]|jgi:uncharacterized protein YjcR|nr:MAG: hypothetical protein CVU62_08115 [Deltaproteobacteria bacterium HGW-Deltaproteobacteria-2]